MIYSHPLYLMSISPPILRYSYFKIWPWKSLVKAMCGVKGQVHISHWKFKGQGHEQGQTHWSHSWSGVQQICLLFVSWQSTIFGCDITNSIFDLENSRSRSWPRSNLMVTFEALSSIDMFAFHFMASDHFCLRSSKFHIWPWKFKV